MTIPFNKNLNKISTYEPGKSEVKNSIKRVIKLSSNESPFGPSKKAIEAYQNSSEKLSDVPKTSFIIQMNAEEIYFLIFKTKSIFVI